MTMSDPLGDMLTRIRNGQSARKDTVISPASRFRLNVLDVLKREGYIRDYSRVELRPGVHELKIELKYHDGLPVISEIQRVSRPGRRVYSKIKDLTRVYTTVLALPYFQHRAGLCLTWKPVRQRLAEKSSATYSKERVICHA